MSTFLLQLNHTSVTPLFKKQYKSNTTVLESGGNDGGQTLPRIDLQGGFGNADIVPNIQR